MYQNQSLKEAIKEQQTQKQEIPRSKEVEQFVQISTMQETISYNIESQYGSEAMGSQKGISQINNSGNVKSNDIILDFVLNNKSLDYTVSNIQNENENENTNENENDREHTKTRVEEEQDFDDGAIFSIPEMEPIQKKLTYDDLNRKCNTLEKDLQKQKIATQGLINKNEEDQQRIKKLQENDHQNKEEIKQHLIKIQTLEHQNQEISSQLQLLLDKESNQQLKIKKYEEQINQMQEQIQKNNQQKSNFQDQINQYQQKLIKLQFQNDQNLKSGFLISNEQKLNLKQNELMKIKDQIIQYLENELAELRVQNIQKQQQQNLNKLKLNTNYLDQAFINNKQQVSNKIQQIPKSEIQKKQLQPQDCQKLIQQSYSNSQKKPISVLALLNEKNQNLLKSYSNSQRNNQSFSNCSITESINQNCQKNENQLILIDNT